MTDSEKLDLILKKVVGLDEKFTGLDEKFAGLDQKVSKLDERVASLEMDMIDVKADLRRVHRENNFILDEVERVHEILNRHKADKRAHTA